MGAGRGQSGRSALAALALIGVWVAAYWLWPANDRGAPAPITFDNLRAAADLDAKPTIASSDASTQPSAAAAAPASNPAQPAAAPQLVVKPPRFTQHVVQARETMQSIAARVYGDESLWTAIAKANPFADPAKLRAGDTLRIPIDPDNIQGIPAPKPPPNAEQPRFPLEHVVQPDETLSDIAKRFYGRASLYGRIFDANRALLRSPDEIKPGMRLLIPPPPGAEE